MLGPDDIERFITQGYLYLPGAIAEERVTAWVQGAAERVRSAPAETVWEYRDPDVRAGIGDYDPQQPESWPKGRITVSGGDDWAVRDIAPSVWEAMVALAGSPQRLQSDRWADEIIIDHRPGSGVGAAAQTKHRWHFHVDDPQPDATLSGYPVGFVALVLLSDIGPGEGATVLSLDSLGAMVRLLATHPQGFDLTDNHSVGREVTQLASDPADRVEVVGRAGDVYLTHGLVAHAVGPALPRVNSDGPWRRIVANPGARLRDGLRLGGDAAPVDRAVMRHLDQAALERLRSAGKHRPVEISNGNAEQGAPLRSTRPEEPDGARSRRGPLKSEVIEAPLPIPGWLSEAMRESGLGPVVRLGGIVDDRGVGFDAGLRLSLTPAEERPDVVLMYGPVPTNAASSRRRMPFESEHLCVAYAGGDGGEAAMAVCQLVGKTLGALGRSGRLGPLFDRAKAALMTASKSVAAAPYDEGTEPIGQQPMRRLSAPPWFAQTFEALGFLVTLFGRRGELRVTLDRRDAEVSAPVIFRLVEPHQVPFKLAWASDGIGIVYSGHDESHRALCGQIGLALLHQREALLNLLRRADELSEARWSCPEVAEAMRAAAAIAGDAGTAGPGAMPRILRSTLHGLNVTSVDALAIAACALNMPFMVLQLQRCHDQAPLTKVLAAWLRGEPQRATEHLEEVVALRPNDELVLRAAVDLARLLGAANLATAWSRRRVTNSPGNARGLALLRLSECAFDSDDAQTCESALVQASRLLNHSTTQLQMLARTARLVRHHGIAAMALKKAAQRTRNPAAQVALAEMALWDLDIERAAVLAEHGHGHPDLGLRARADLVLGACQVLLGELAAGRETLRVATKHHPEPETVWAWRCDAASRAGDWEAAEVANDEGQATLHTLANALTGCLWRARQATAKGDTDRPWLLSEHDPDGVLFGRLDAWVGEERCTEARATIRTAGELLEAVRIAIGGNLTRWLTRREGGRLDAVIDPGSPRMRSARVLFGLANSDPHRADRALRAVVDRFQDAPQPPCFLGELHLWWGRYDAAEAAFQVAHGRGGTRWAWIGQGAVRHMRGQYDQAQERFDTCVARCGFLEGATLVGYTGEMKRLMGDAEGALQDLQTAVRTRPGRVGAWINLAFLALDRGDHAAASRAVREVYLRVPYLMERATEATGIVPPESVEALADAQALRAALQWALDAMLGNRSSAVWTHRDDAAPGGLRTLPDPSPLQSWAQAHLDLAETLGG